MVHTLSEVPEKARDTVGVTSRRIRLEMGRNCMGGKGRECESRRRVRAVKKRGRGSKGSRCSTRETGFVTSRRGGNEETLRARGGLGRTHQGAWGMPREALEGKKLKV